MSPVQIDHHRAISVYFFQAKSDCCRGLLGTLSSCWFIAMDRVVKMICRELGDIWYQVWWALGRVPSSSFGWRLCDPASLPVESHGLLGWITFNSLWGCAPDLSFSRRAEGCAQDILAFVAASLLLIELRRLDGTELQKNRCLDERRVIKDLTN